MVINGREIEKEISDYEPCIASLRLDETGHLWVRHSRSDQDQPEGVFQTYDVFDPHGHLVRQVAVACPGDPQADGLFLIGENHAVLIRAMMDAAVAMVGIGGDDEDEAENEAAPLEIVYYRLAK
jgi:hypothetical protein